jgi:hypothetical protein
LSTDTFRTQLFFNVGTILVGDAEVGRWIKAVELAVRQGSNTEELAFVVRVGWSGVQQLSTALPVHVALQVVAEDLGRDALGTFGDLKRVTCYK